MDKKRKKYLIPIVLVVVVVAVIVLIANGILSLLNRSEIQVTSGDVLATIEMCLPYLIPMLLVIVAAIVVAIVARKCKQPVRYIARTQSVIAVVLALLLGVNGICFGPVYGMLSQVLMDPINVSDDTYQSSLDLIEQIAAEGTVLLENKENTLPLSSDVKKLNVFGWGSTHSLTSRGSYTPGSMTLLEGLEDGGYEINQELADFYNNYREDSPYVGLDRQDWTVVEPTMEEYDAAGIFENAKSFSDTALIVISRPGGENADLPQSISDVNTYESGIYGEAVVYTTNADDVDPSKHLLELSNREEAMVERVANEFDQVIVLLNVANPFELGWINEYPSIKAVLMCYKPGQNGFAALGDILNGTVNPSGKLPDINLYDNLSAPCSNNFGYFVYDNMYDVVNSENLQAWKDELRASFVNCVEGIYVGYKFFETAAAEGLLNYDEYVQYPFGYGLSYTTFEQTISDFQDDGTTITVSVDVTNTGSVAGKDVVQLYYTPPYYNGGIEKSEVNLIEFGKTGLLQPGESETITVSFSYEDMASYDEYVNGCYVLEHGDYVISLRSDSHTVLDSRTITLDQDIIYNDDNAGKRSTDMITAENQFDFASGDITYLSRADHFANYAEAVAAPAVTSLGDEYIDGFICAANYDVSTDNVNPDAVMPTTGANNGLEIRDMIGLAYDDPQWDQLLDQLSVDEMERLITVGGYSSQALDSINLKSIVETDGPAGIRSNFAQQNGTTFPAATMLAATWNKELASEMGRLVAEQGRQLRITGWYAPAVNIHRSPFSGRAIEYYSEDPVLSGVIAANQTAAAVEGGMICFVKHFALNEQETNRNDILLTWANEQSIRETYMKPFEIVYKEGNANACMSSFAYIGNQYAGACDALLNTVLRDEWGFRGMVITDYFADYGYMMSDNIMRNGGDKMLTMMAQMSALQDKTSPTAVTAMRTATHNILFTIANSNATEDWNYNTPIWEQVFTGVNIGVALLIVLAEAYIFTRGRKKHSADIQA